jgi:fused signal recognition particle receptor
VARDWYDLFITNGSGPAPAPEEEREQQRRGFFRRMRENMRKTREALAGRGPGDAVRGRPRRGDLGAARGGADLRRRRRAHDRAGRRELEREAEEGGSSAASS